MTNISLKKHLSWLHLSDFHLKESDQWSQDVVLKSLLTDISNRYSTGLPLDFIFITGDLAFSGKTEEYLIVEDFLSQLLASTGVPCDRLLIVPGNHDINRNIELDAFAGARRLLTDSAEVDKFLGNEGRRRTLFRRQSAFREFANRMSKEHRYSETSYQHSVQYDIDGLSIAALLIDSTWLSEGGETDSHCILVGERQLIDVSSKLSEPALVVGLMHHPMDWLAPFEHTAIKHLAAENCHLLFRGHVHEDSVEILTQAGNQLKVFTAGASYESRLSANCYGYGVVDLLTGDGECIIHKYRNNIKTWEKQEPVSWTLTDRQHYSINLHDVASIVSSHETPYTSYLTCLVAQKVMEIPILHGSELIFLSLSDPMAAQTNLAKSIQRLGFLIHWRACWHRDQWDAAIVQCLNLYSEAMNDCADGAHAQSSLSNREEHCERILKVLLDGGTESTGGNQIVLQALKLADRGSIDLGLTILHRMLEQLDLSEIDEMAALRVQAKLHLAHGNDGEAASATQRLLQFPHATGQDHLLDATCCVNVDNYERASENLERACSLGVPFSQLKGIAIRVAGSIGDPGLLARLEKGDV